ncbi:MAG: metallophosphoesterase [Lachnospiraceae bacterium]|nr:metallophosphoesterase [Lachnospiraceae bacterium]
MRILIVSDTHGFSNNLIKDLKHMGEPDMLIHAGDSSGEDEYIKNLVHCPVKMVLGNNDYSMKLAYEEEFEVEGYRFLLTHGHRDHVYFGTDRLMYKAIERGVDVVVYGHTHIPSIEYDDNNNVYCVNPGSISFPRQSGRKPSYMLCDIDKDGEIHFSIYYLE